MLKRSADRSCGLDLNLNASYVLGLQDHKTDSFLSHVCLTLEHSQELC